MKKRKFTLLSFTVTIVALSMMFLVFCGSKATNNTSNEIFKEIDAFLLKKYSADKPGAAVLVVKDGKVLLRKGYGMANMELGIPVKPEHVFRIGSVTKQFTASLIMKLVEEGKISLQDEITNFLPDYPTKGTKITVHHLLNHTSGIQSYTSMNTVMARMREDFTVEKLIDEFKDQPMNFFPGEKYRYNNSAYFLLGAVIEKVTGKTYEAYLNEKIFKPLGMMHSYFGSHSRIIPNRITGYEKDGDGFVNAGYLSMTMPYAAGSLLSTVDDLWTWTKALHSGKVVWEKSFQSMTTPTKTSDGKNHNYGYGLSVEPLFGEKLVGHGGGINGFVCQVLRLPEKDIFVAVLNNSIGVTDPGYIANWIAARLADKSVQEKKAITLDTKILDQVVGVYEIEKDKFRTITREGDKLFSTRTGGRRMEVFAASETEFFYKDSFSSFTIVKDENGKVIKMVMHRPDADEEAVKTDKKPDQKKAITLDSKDFDALTGLYAGDSGMEITIKREGEKYIVHLKGQPEYEIFPESKTKFFLKAFDATLEFETDTEGKGIAFTLHMGERDIKLKKK